MSKNTYNLCNREERKELFCEYLVHRLPRLSFSEFEENIEFLCNRGLSNELLIMCAETRNKLSGGGGETTTIIFTPSQLFLQNRLQGYLSDKELHFGRQLIQSEDDNVFNRTVNMILHELVNDGTILQQQEGTPDYPIEKYQTTQKLDVICKEFRDAGLPY